MLAGRGFGKTISLNYALFMLAVLQPERKIGIIAPTAGEIRRVSFEGESGLMSIIPRECLWRGDEKHAYRKSPNYEIRLWNGSLFQGYNAFSYDRIRGSQWHYAGCDEVAAWRYIEEAMEQVEIATRLGKSPFIICSTTPRPLEIIKKRLKSHQDGDHRIHLTTGTTFENTALSSIYLDRLKEKYHGTRIGEQELYGVVLEDIEGALWTRDMIEKGRVNGVPKELDIVVVAIDPAVTADEKSDETGIVVGGGHLQSSKFYAIDDVSGRYTPQEWARQAIVAYQSHSANLIVGEVNQGGDMVETMIRQEAKAMGIEPPPFRAVRATRGKMVRAEPIAALYEQGRVHHCNVLQQLEAQMVTYIGDRRDKSPDRLDALVWCFTYIMQAMNQRRGGIVHVLG